MILSVTKIDLRHYTQQSRDNQVKHGEDRIQNTVGDSIGEAVPS